MTATDILRRLLDERGVEWRRTPHYSSESQDNETVFAGDGIEWCANDHLNGRLGLRALRYEVTPAQAIDATLGRGTCRLVRHGSLADHDSFACWSCSECDFGWHHSVHDKQFSYCPNCGREVVNDQ